MRPAFVSALLRRTPLWAPLKVAYNDVRAYSVLRQIRQAGGEGLRILAINHCFDGELESLACAADRLDGVSIQSIAPEPLFSRALAWFPRAAQDATLSYDDPTLRPIRARYRAYCERLFARLRAQYPFDCVLTPSDLFFWLREFLLVCKERGVPTVVADKEGMISRSTFESWPARIRAMCPPIADVFFVWSERQAQFWINAGLSPERIRVMGSARTDLFVRLERNAAAATVLVFDFDADAYINDVDWAAVTWQGERTWRRFREAYYGAIARVAAEFSGITFVIKCHPQQVHTAFPDAGLERLSNVRVIKGAPRGLPALIRDARAVVGFQTTALAEAALTGVPVVYAAWGDLFEAVKDRLLPWHDSRYRLTWCRSDVELAERLRSMLTAPGPVTADRDPAPWSGYFHNPDAGVAERVLSALQSLAAKTHASYSD